MYIGKRLREIRKAKGMSLSALAEKSGVQIATLSRIEHLKMTGSLESHMNIAKALEIDVTHLYTDIIKEKDKEKVDIKTAKTSGTDMYVHSDKSSSEILTSKVLTKKMMPTLIKMEPEGRTNKEQNQHGSEKFVFVLEGKVDVEVGGECYTVVKNNTLYFDGSIEHVFYNRSKSPAKVLCVTTPVAL